MKERPCVIGQKPALVGVVAEPGRLTPDLPVFVLVNAGLVHHVGPNRLYVQLARQLAQAGYASIRVDLSGRGDSDVRRDSLSFRESAPIEITAALDYLERTRGWKRFVVMGICSGAVNSFQAASAEARVVGAIMIDPPAHPTPQYYLRRYLSKAASISRWRDTLLGRTQLGARLWRRSALAEPAQHQEADGIGEFGDDAKLPPREESDAAITSVVARGVQLLVIYTGSWKSYLYRNQFRDAYPRAAKSGRVHVEYFPNSDHTFTRLFHQRLLMTTVAAWIAEKWPAAEATQVAVPPDAKPSSAQSGGLAFDPSGISR